MTRDDATAAELEALEDAATHADHALAEAEERLEEDPGALAEVERCRRRLETAEAALTAARARRRLRGLQDA